MESHNQNSKVSFRWWANLCSRLVGFGKCKVCFNNSIFQAPNLLPLVLKSATAIPSCLPIYLTLRQQPAPPLYLDTWQPVTRRVLRGSTACLVRRCYWGNRCWGCRGGRAHWQWKSLHSTVKHITECTCNLELELAGNNWNPIWVIFFHLVLYFLLTLSI